MTGNTLMPGTPDGVTGMLFALEGIRGAVVLLNGPMGCRFYHSTTSQFLSIHPLLCIPGEDGKKVPVDYNHLDNWFFRQQRIPCTYLDGEDYVFGTAQKVREGLQYLREHIDLTVLGVVNAPGASLIGDQLDGMVREIFPDKMTVVLESPGFTTDFDHGYEEACLQLLQQNRTSLQQKGCAQKKKEPGREPVVNVLGLSIWDRYFEGDREEIGRLLAACGIRVNCFLSADCTPQEIRNLPRADLNLVVDAARGAAAAAWMEEHCGIPALVCDGLPIGFDQTEALCRKVCGLLQTDAKAVLEQSGQARALAWYKLNGIYQSSGLPQGGLFAVAARLPQVYAYTRFLAGYLGMVPDALAITGMDHPSLRSTLETYLQQRHASAALTRPLEETEAELVFSDANRISALMVRNQAFCGIEISLPGMGYTDLVKKTHLGIQGALFLTEQVINGLMTRL